MESGDVANLDKRASQKPLFRAAIYVFTKDFECMMSTTSGGDLTKSRL